MPQKASSDNSRTSVGVRLDKEELAELDKFIEKLRVDHPNVTRSSIMRIMLRKYLHINKKETVNSNSDSQ